MDAAVVDLRADRDFSEERARKLEPLLVEVVALAEVANDVAAFYHRMAMGGLRALGVEARLTRRVVKPEPPAAGGH